MSLTNKNDKIAFLAATETVTEIATKIATETGIDIINKKKYELPKGYAFHNYVKYSFVASNLYKNSNERKKNIYKLNDDEIEYVSQSIDHAGVIVSNHNKINTDNYDDIVRYVNDPLVTICKTFFLFEMKGKKEMLKKIRHLFTNTEITAFFSSLIHNQMQDYMQELFELGYIPSVEYLYGIDFLIKHAIPDNILCHLITSAEMNGNYVVRINRSINMPILELALLTINTNEYQLNNFIFKCSTKISYNFIEKITNGYYHIEYMMDIPYEFICHPWTDDKFSEFLEKVKKYGLMRKIQNFHMLERFTINMGPKSMFQWKSMMPKL